MSEPECVVGDRTAAYELGSPQGTLLYCRRMPVALRYGKIVRMPDPAPDRKLPDHHIQIFAGKPSLLPRRQPTLIN
jgi:hypothetical protein